MEQVAYFTLKDREDKPKCVVCIMESNGHVAYGISIKSQQDKWRQGKGFKLARERAKSALMKSDFYFSAKNCIITSKAFGNLYDLCKIDFARLFNIMTSDGIFVCVKCEVINRSFNDAVKQFCN